MSDELRVTSDESETNPRMIPHIQRTRQQWLDIYRRGISDAGLFHSTTHRECPMCGKIFKKAIPGRKRDRCCCRKCRDLFDKARIHAREWGLA